MNVKSTYQRIYRVLVENGFELHFTTFGFGIYRILEPSSVFSVFW